MVDRIIPSELSADEQWRRNGEYVSAYAYDEATATIAALQTTIRAMERALWMALDGREVVVRDDTPVDLEWSETEDGGQMVRRSMAWRLKAHTAEQF